MSDYMLSVLPRTGSGEAEGKRHDYGSEMTGRRGCSRPSSDTGRTFLLTVYDRDEFSFHGRLFRR